MLIVESFLSRHHVGQEIVTMVNCDLVKVIINNSKVLDNVN